MEAVLYMRRKHLLVSNSQLQWLRGLTARSATCASHITKSGEKSLVTLFNEQVKGCQYTENRGGELRDVDPAHVTVVSVGLFDEHFERMLVNKTNPTNPSMFRRSRGPKEDPLDVAKSLLEVELGLQEEDILPRIHKARYVQYKNCSKQIVRAYIILGMPEHWQGKPHGIVS